MISAGCIAGLLAATAIAQSPPPAPSAYVEVTATRIEEDLMPVPASITVISGAEIARSGATNLAAALTLAGGVAVGAGTDEGPAGVVPELWGLRELDAFLLVVDGVPAGGAFNPATSAIDLTNVERIEILHGSAPVIFGATAFSGVINVIHRHPSSGTAARISAGSFGSASVGLTTALGATQSISATIDRDRFRDRRSGADRGNLFYRGEAQTARGRWQFDVTALRLLQDPASPHLVEGAGLSRRIPIDANQNPSDAHINTTRLEVATSYLSSIGQTPWTTTLGLTGTNADIVRGFLNDPDAVGQNADGFNQKRSITDLYLDSHVVRQLRGVRLLLGAEILAGDARWRSRGFAYFVPLDGSSAPSSSSREHDAAIDSRDRRAFGSLYAQSEWAPSAGWRVDAGVRLNHTRESRSADEDRDGRNATRGSGSLGLSRMMGANASIFADYRNTFKPAAIDFGPDAEADILQPERSQSFEIGARGKQLDQRLFWQASLFDMDLRNLVLSQSQGGLPVLVNAGRERFRGAEIESNFAVRAGLRLSASYSWHDARFRDFVQDFDGTPEQFAGHRLEMSARHLASAGARVDRGVWGASLNVNFVGSRFLNRENTALADPYTAVNAGISRSTPWGDLRFDVRNLTDRRPPVSDSELGESQFYLQPSRSVFLSWSRAFATAP